MSSGRRRIRRGLLWLLCVVCTGCSGSADPPRSGGVSPATTIRPAPVIERTGVDAASPVTTRAAVEKQVVVLGEETQADHRSASVDWRKEPEVVAAHAKVRPRSLAGAGLPALCPLLHMIRGARQLLHTKEGERRFQAACQALSELAVSSGELFTAEVQFYVGLGHFFGGRAGEAIHAYGMTVRAACDSERRVAWVPEALFQRGHILFVQERYLEAALSYRVVFEQFPECARARDAVRYALSSAKRAIEQFDEASGGTMSRLYRSIEGGAVMAAGAAFQAQTAMRDAAPLLQKEVRSAPEDGVDLASAGATSIASSAPTLTREGSRLPVLASRLLAGPDGKTVVPLRAVDTVVRIDGFRARVVLDLSFAYELKRSSQGTFMIHLPPGATPYFLAFGERTPRVTARPPDPRGGCRERVTLPRDVTSFRGDPNPPRVARMVERSTAERAYVATVHRRVDPALLEWVKPGVFRCRVFPLMPNKTHRIVLGFDLDLECRGQDLVLRLGLPVAPRRTAVISVGAGSGDAVEVTPPAETSRVGGRLRLDLPDLQQDDTIRVRLRRALPAQLTGDGPTGSYFAVALLPPRGRVAAVSVLGGRDVLVANEGRVRPGRPLVIVGRGTPAAPCRVRLRLRRGGTVETRLVAPRRVLSSPLVPRLYGCVATAELEALGSSATVPALAFARYFRVPSETASLLMLEREADYLQHGIRAVHDGAAVRRARVRSLLGKHWGRLVCLRTDPKFALLARLEEAELRSVRKACAALPRSTFEVDPGRLSRTASSDEWSRVLAKALKALCDGSVLRAWRQLAVLGTRVEGAVDVLRALCAERLGRPDLALVHFELASTSGGRLVALEYLRFLESVARGGWRLALKRQARTRQEELRARYGALPPLSVLLVWSGEGADLDLRVSEPNFEECYYGRPETAYGGRITVDQRSGLGLELYFAGWPLRGGLYSARVHYFARSHASTGPATAYVRTCQRAGGSQVVRRRLVTLGKPGETRVVGRFPVVR